MAMAPQQLGIGIRRHFTEPGVHPYDTLEWERRDARIPNFKDGGDAFFQSDVEFPVSWSQNATNIVAQKYFRGTLGTPERESSLRQVIDRVADTVTAWGVRDGYFVDDAEAEAFRAELKYVLVHQHAAFNSPVWFNIGVNGVPQQASACQPYDAMVATPDGLIPIGKLVEDGAVSTKVFDAHGITRVVAVKHNGKKPVLRVHTKAGITLDVTPDHVVWRHRRGEGAGWVEAQQLQPGDQLEWHPEDVAMRRLEIERIESLGVMDVYDIQTESGEYLSNHLRVHNCFILAVDDTMDAILNWYREEGIIFKGGSGAGINLSGIRSSKEHLKGGGTASGPVSFMRGADASAGTIKCLHGDTPIVTQRGVFPIRDVRPDDNVLTRFGYERVAAVHDNGVRPLVRVRTSLGDELRCTPEHRFWVRTPSGEQWKKASELQASDYVVLDVSGRQDGELQPMTPIALRHHNEHAHELPETLDEPFACWLGWVFGDGSITYNKDAKFVAVEIGDTDAELAGRYKAIATAVFGGGLRFYESRRRNDASISMRFSSGPIIRFLEANGLRKQPRADLLRVPAAIQAAPRPVRAAFLAGLFEADGHVGNGYPQLSTVSTDFARDVHRLLLSLGIPSHLGRIDDRRTALGTRPVHVVRIVGGEGVRRFAKLVGFVSERKHVALEQALTRKAASPFETQWHLPHIATELDAVWMSTPDPVLRRALSPFCRVARPRRMSLLRARALIERFPDALEKTSLAHFAFGEEIYAPVSVVEDGEGPTFDLTIDGVHEYLVQSIVTHNSGGKTRRAAKMVILNADHPDVEEFVWCKAIEERKARALRDAGFDMDLDGRDSHSIQYQNANNSVRVSDDFMDAVANDREWALRAVKDGTTVQTLKARDLIRQIATAAWECADPGMQFDTTINKWHTASNTGRINASNPCAEYVHLDNSACNLASINLMRYLRDDDTFDVEGFRHGVEIMFTAQEILVGNADYPTDKIAETTRAFRQLGLGYANLGALLMALGMPYDSDEGRAWAAAITALMTGHAYATSAKTASRMGPFAGYAENREPMLNVLRMHREETAHIDSKAVPAALLGAAREAWDQAVEIGEQHGVRNSQATVIAPTGTISLMMDCDTTGIEPDLALTKAKKLVGGGTMLIVNHTVPRALRNLGYSDDEGAAIVAYINEHKTILGSPVFKDEHMPVFACSMGDNTIHYMGHVKMMSAVQPFISGAISKTVNMPEEVTIEEVEQLYLESWRMGLKAVAIYRDNCKVGQPLSTQRKGGEIGDPAGSVAREVERIVETIIVQEPVRQKLPRTRSSRTFSFRVADCHGYVTVGEYQDGRPGELFLKVAKQGSTLAGIMDAFAIGLSMGLQYGVPLEAFIEKFTNMRFEPAGMTDDPDIRFATSLVDYIFRRLAVEYLPPDKREAMGILTVNERLQPTLPGVEESTTPNNPTYDLPFADRAPGDARFEPTGPTPPAPTMRTPKRDVVLCHVCGDMMQRAGSCYACPSCGSTSGCS